MLRLAVADPIPEIRIEKSDENIRLAFLLERKLRFELHVSVRIHVSDEQIQLFGTVATWYQKQQVQEFVRERAPEYRIRNELQVCGDFRSPGV